MCSTLHQQKPLLISLSQRFSCTRLHIVLLVLACMLEISSALLNAPRLVSRGQILRGGVKSRQQLASPSVRAWPWRDAIKDAAENRTPEEFAKIAAVRTASAYVDVLNSAKGCPSRTCTTVFIHIPKTGMWN